MSLWGKVYWGIRQWGKYWSGGGTTTVTPATTEVPKYSLALAHKSPTMPKPLYQLPGLDAELAAPRVAFDLEVADAPVPGEAVLRWLQQPPPAKHHRLTADLRLPVLKVEASADAEIPEELALLVGLVGTLR